MRAKKVNPASSKITTALDKNVKSFIFSPLLSLNGPVNRGDNRGLKEWLQCKNYVFRGVFRAMTEKSAKNEIFRLSQPLVLVGMMGVGKSHIGAGLAKKLGVPFYDSDKVIQDNAGLTISHIFEEFGEPKFREVEKKTIAGLLAQGPCVLATGGGAILDPYTLARLKAETVMVWLDCAFDVLWARLKNQKDRPLLKTDNPQERLRELLAQRETLYQQAHIHVAFSDESKAQVTKKVIKSLSEFMNKDNF